MLTVEDALVSINLLQAQGERLDEASSLAHKALQLTSNQYEAGIVDKATVVTYEIAALTAEQNALDLVGEQLVSSVNLVTALGGGWDAKTYFSREEYEQAP